MFFFYFLVYMDRSNSILRYLKRKQPGKGNASGSEVSSDINEYQRNGENESESNIHSKSGGNESSGGQSSRGSEFDLSTLPINHGLRKMILEYYPNLQD